MLLVTVGLHGELGMVCSLGWTKLTRAGVCLNSDPARSVCIWWLEESDFKVHASMDSRWHRKDRLLKKL